MTEPSPESRQAPRRGAASLADLTLLVVIPGRPEYVRAFTDDEHQEAADYAAATGGTVQPLPK